MTIDALPTAPNRNMTPEAFVAAADAFVAALPTFASQVNSDLNLILNIAGLLATSSTSVLIGTGSKSFAVEASKAFLAGQSVRAYSNASPANYMLGTVTSYDAGTGDLVLDVTSVGGSGTLAAWTVVLAASGEWLGNATTASSAANLTATSKITYASGGSVTQLTSKSTGVTLNKFTGKITTHNANLPANSAVSFTLTSSEIGGPTTNVILAQHLSGGTVGAYHINVSNGGFAGEAIVTIRNLTAGDLAEAIEIGFTVFACIG